MIDGEEADDTAAVDPIEFLRRALAISPEDAAAVREDAAKASSRRDERDDPEAVPRGQYGPTADLGDDQP